MRRHVDPGQGGYPHMMRSHGTEPGLVALTAAQEVKDEYRQAGERRWHQCYPAR